MNGVPLAAYLGLSMFMFTTGVVGVIIRRNPIVIFMCIELMLNAVNLAFLSFARYRFATEGHTLAQGMSGPMMVIFVMAVAAAEVAVGLGIIMAIYRLKEEVDVDDLNLIKG
ncbi:MAG: NADH-quinone oxidoreductase subunit NuoK [Armatimonadetes bacterium]|nr:NADH-quinone oxidoreductase subunit NuoK [Armatimonadota bacterium]MBS1703128.1 NADH-quinone oxidoreductase subunit NuoK [Armatimonadota bacterium]